LKDTVLSIDLDYWKTVTPTMMDFLRQSLKLDVPKVLTKYHHRILPFVNRHKANVLINVDYHADLCEDDPRNRLPELNCGTWVNHVKWRHNGTFVWVCPSKNDCYHCCEGRCDSSRDNKTDPFKNDNNGWAVTKVRTGLKYVNLQRVKAIGFTLSPDYLFWNVKVGERTTKRIERYYNRLSELLPIPLSWVEKQDYDVERVIKI
jgi:hypothetical protein